MVFTLFTSSCRGNEENCFYPQKVQVDSPDKLKAAVENDHVCATYRNCYRGKGNFIKSDVIPMDIDNDRTADSQLYITPEKLDELFPDVSYCIVPSRNHNRPKGSKPAAPRYHIFFPIPECTDADEYALMKVKLQKAYPFFDDNALDAGRLLYGAVAKEVVWHEGWMSITDEIEDTMFPETDIDEKPEEPQDTGIIHEGNRNNAMHKFANRILKRYGISEKAHALFKERAKKCSPPLGDDELATIWNSAEKFYRTKVMTQEGYVPPDVYNTEFTGSLKPDDFSDIGQARVLSREYGDELFYTSETDFLRYDGTVWVEDKQLAVGAAVEFEAALVDEVKRRGGMCPKFTSPGMDGMPDRLVLLPHGRFCFVEVKAPGEKPRPLQLHRHQQLRRLGFKVYVLDGTEQIGGILDEIEGGDAT